MTVMYMRYACDCYVYEICVWLQVYVKRGDVESKMLSALLTGVNRTYPYVKGLSVLHCATFSDFQHSLFHHFFM